MCWQQRRAAGEEYREPQLTFGPTLSRQGHLRETEFSASVALR